MNLFVIEEIDKKTKSIVKQHLLSIHNFEELKEINKSYDFDEVSSMDINPKDMKILKKKFDIKCLNVSRWGRIRLRNETDKLPYQVHTGRELLLMIKGEKPLAFFSELSELASDPVYRFNQPFETYVKKGYLKHFKHEFEEVFPGENSQNSKTVRFISDLYTLPGEEWRAKAMILLKEAQKAGWCEAMERMEGTLLGYTKQENDQYIKLIYNPED